jgi:hypothetical protein
VSGHIIVQQRSGAAQVANLRPALVKKSHFEKMRIPFVRMFATPRALLPRMAGKFSGPLWSPIQFLPVYADDRPAGRTHCQIQESRPGGMRRDPQRKLVAQRRIRSKQRQFV